MARAVGTEALDQLLPLVRLEVASEQRREVVRNLRELQHARVLLVPDVKGALHLLLRLARAEQVRAKERAQHLLHLGLLEAGATQRLAEPSGALELRRFELHRLAHVEQ